MENQVPEDELADVVVRKYVPGKVVANPKNTLGCSVNAMAINSEGRACVSAWKDVNDTVGLYNALNGEEVGIMCRAKYGVSHVRFLHSETLVAMTAKRSLGSGKKHLMIYNFNGNKDLRHFHAHKGKITSLKVHPAVDMVMTAGTDRRIHVWDVRDSANRPVKTIILKGAVSPCVDFDPKGVVFAAAHCCGKESFVNLFDLRKVGDGAFDKWELPGETQGWHDIQFSPDGSKVLLTPAALQTVGGVLNTDVPHWVLHSFTGKLLGTLNEHVGVQGAVSGPQWYEGAMYTSFSPDSKYVVGGALDYSLRVWSMEDNSPAFCNQVGKWDAIHERLPIGPVAWNKVYNSVISASVNLTFWQPSNPSFSSN